MEPLDELHDLAALRAGRIDYMCQTGWNYGMEPHGTEHFPASFPIADFNNGAACYLAKKPYPTTLAVP